MTARGGRGSRRGATARALQETCQKSYGRIVYGGGVAHERATGRYSAILTERRACRAEPAATDISTAEHRSVPPTLPTPPAPDHKLLVQQAFTSQAAAYAANPAIADTERLERLVRAVAPRPTDRVLEVATGPGFVALAFAAHCQEVVGVDLTAAPLAIAEQRRRERGLDNVRFEVGDAEALGYADAAFEVAVCRFAFHHFADPAGVLREMARVCRAGGAVAIEDLIVSEREERAAYQNTIERLRDPSHTRAFSLGQLLALFTAAGLDVAMVYTGTLQQQVERWLANAKTPPAQAAEVRRLIEDDAARDLPGMRPLGEGGTLLLLQRTVTVIGRKLDPT